MATRKALTHFRKLISKLNKELHTVQIYQCNGEWRNIDFNKNVTSITLKKQSKAFDLKDKYGEDKRMDVGYSLDKWNDRLKCKENYNKYLDDCRKGVKKVKGDRVSIIDFVRDAIKLQTHYDNDNNDNNDNNENDLINMQWIENSKGTKNQGNIIVMVDTSASMSCDNNIPLYSAIGLGIRFAEKSRLGKRVMTFNAIPEWINLEGLDFVQMVKKISKGSWGMNTNFEAAFKLILEAGLENNVTPDEMKNFVLLICSDMQIDQVVNNNDLMFDRMRKMYYEAGLNSVYKVPFELPHIVFWNLRCTTGFPLTSNTKNTTMLSGNSPNLLNDFGNQGLDILKDLTPWKYLIKQLNSNRYNKLDKVINDIWSRDMDKYILVD
tara:strand:- start:521 stop:1657 length:1137 start_codon:yes stop_codon:yes gene_type:complete